MHVVGLTGFEGAGKSTAAQYLVERHGFTRVSFAAPLKRMVLSLDPYVSSSFDDQFYRVSEILETHGETEAKKLFPEYRRLLQVLGTDCIRAEQEDFWIEAAGRQLRKPWGKYVFDDCRFPNEAEFIKEQNLLGLWNIERPGFGPVNSHPSAAYAGNLGETVFLFNSDLESLHDQIDNAVDMAFEGVKA
jgi:hypothetical protein